jgi:autotransporter-associated beta strand protein
VNNGRPQNTVVTINSGGVLDLNNFDQSVRGIQGSGVVLNNVGGTRTLTLTPPAAGETLEFTGTIRNAGGIVAVTKTGPGTQILSGTLHYTGATNINEGTLLIDGVNTASSAYNVAPAATLGGAGIITGPIAVSANGTLSPGGNTLSTEIASMRIGNLNLGLDANLAIDLSGGIAGTGLSASAGYDQVDAIGTVSVNGANLQLELNYAPALGDRLFIINNDQIDAIVGTFAKLNGATTTLTEGSLFNLTSSLNSNTYFFRISYLGEFYTNNVGTGNDVVLTAVVPESTSAAALAIAAAGLLSRRRRK